MHPPKRKRFGGRNEHHEREQGETQLERHFVSQALQEEGPRTENYEGQF